MVSIPFWLSANACKSLELCPQVYIYNGRVGFIVGTVIVSILLQTLFIPPLCICIEVPLSIAFAIVGTVIRN